MKTIDLAELTLESAKPLEGMTFEVTLPEGNIIQMKLEEILPFERRQRRSSRGTPELKREPFALYFLGPPSMILPQGMYTFHSEMVTLEGVFIVPIGRDDEGVEYEAV